jgi:CheY-like chemotaxis protein
MSSRAATSLLIVEDGDDDRMVYRIVLTRQPAHGLSITLASTGEEGLQALRTRKFDCLLLDHDLPDMTGLDMLDKAMGRGGQLPCAVVMVTGSNSDRIAAEALRRGVRAVLLKDQLDETVLRDAIGAALATTAGPPLAACPPLADSGTMLSIAAAKLGLAATFGVSPANVEIIIHA